MGQLNYKLVKANSYKPKHNKAVKDRHSFAMHWSVACDMESDAHELHEELTLYNEVFLCYVAEETCMSSASTGDLPIKHSSALWPSRSLCCRKSVTTDNLYNPFIIIKAINKLWVGGAPPPSLPLPRCP